MASNERFMPVAPEAVWDALADAYGYGYWVVGSSEIRDVDDGWPQPGTRFHHTVGVGPLRVSDHTESLEAERPTLLRIRAKARPLGTAKVTLTLTPLAGGTRVRMQEDPDGLTGWLKLDPFLQLLTKGRNAESLMRLEELALRAAERAPS
ncbi:MAG TPA: SRPBCC domain-containing protein [Conexibacter sp.]|nr:SRPBCC domain-containing protein [Conexibacter sp.]